LTIVRTTVHVAGVVRCHSARIDIDSEPAIGINRIAANGIVGGVGVAYQLYTVDADLFAWTVEGDYIAGAGRGATNGRINGRGDANTLNTIWHRC